MRLILASNSKQRKDIFEKIGWKYEIITSKVKEESNSTNPEEYVKDLAKAKAKSVESQINDKAIIIAADTIICMNGKIYEKPKSKEEAFENLKEMSGKTTYAITGTTINDLYKNKVISFSDTVEVKLKNINDDEIRWYVENEEHLLNISGYAMLGKASLFLDKVNGDYNTLFGISPSKVYNNLKKLGYELKDFETILK